MRRACGQVNDRNHQKKSAPDEPARFFRVLGMILDGIAGAHAGRFTGRSLSFRAPP